MPEEGCQQSQFVNPSPSWVCTSGSQEEAASLQRQQQWESLTRVWHFWKPGCCLGHPWPSSGAFLEQHKLVCPVTGCHQCHTNPNTLCGRFQFSCQTVKVLCPGHCCRHSVSSAEKPAGQPGQLFQLCSPSRVGFSLCPPNCSLSLWPPHCACGSASRDVLWQWHWRESKSNQWCRRDKKPSLAHSYTHRTCLWLERKGFSRAEHTNPMQSSEQ